MKIFIDSYRCSGCASCVELCPDVFYLDEHTEKAQMATEVPPDSKDLRQAIAYCPEKCIEVEE